MIFRPLALLLVPIALAQQLPLAGTDPRSPFLSVPPAASDALRFGAQLPQFETQDIHGRTWRLEDLLGKFTIVYIWTTFEARLQGLQRLPASRDLAELQRFYDKVANAKNIQVLAFCRDDYIQAYKYMNEKLYTFPVIADNALVNKLFPDAGWGTRIIHPEGRLSYPFRSWTFGGVLFEIEKTMARN